MDALASATTNKAKPLNRAVVFALVAVVLLVLVIDLGERANLVDPIPFSLTFASGAAFFAVGVWLSFRLRPPAYYGPVRRVMAHISAPIFAFFIGTFLARTAAEAAAFAGLSPIDTPSEAIVVGKSSGKWGQYNATVSFGPTTRDVHVEITTDLYDRLEPYRAPGRDCLELSTQKGRWSMRRTMLPRRFFDDPIGADHYVQCQQGQDVGSRSY
jgi:hypothetical protein